jgi:hypothetical protein
MLANTYVRFKCVFFCTSLVKNNALWGLTNTAADCTNPLIFLFLNLRKIQATKITQNFVWN